MLSSAATAGAGMLKKRRRGRKRKRKKEEKKNGVYGGPQTTQRSRSWSLTAPVTLPNEETVVDLPCIRHILGTNRLTWSDVGHHPDLRASSTSVNNKQEPSWDLIIDTRRKFRNWIRRNPPPQMVSFSKRGRKDAMNIPSSN